MPNQHLALFAPEEEVLALEHALADLSGDARLPTLIALAWHLRQRDSQRALLLAEEAEAALQAADIEYVERRRHLARITLMRAEISALFGHLDEADRLANLAFEDFTSINHTDGIGDVHWIRSAIALDRGNDKQVNALMSQACDAYLQGNDANRQDAAIARALANLAFTDTQITSNGIEERFPTSKIVDEFVSTWVAIAKANVAGLTDDPGTAMKFDLEAHHAALHTGQIRQAMVCAINAAEGFFTLGDLDAALEWSERALQMARKTEWPASTGIALMQTGNVLRLLGRFDEARVFLEEAQRYISAVPGSRNHEQILANLGQLALDVGQFEAGLRYFAEFEHDLSIKGDADLVMESLCGQATALLRLDRRAESLGKAKQALALAREKGNTDKQIKILRVCADLYQDKGLPFTESFSAPSVELHFLNEALQVVDSMNGYRTPVDLLNQVAGAYANCGDFETAYAFGLKANVARNDVRLEEAQSRALAMRIRHQVDRAQADAENLRALTSTLQEANTTLETLGRIGREITGSLDADAVFDALYRNVDRLLDAVSFVVYLLDNHGDTLYTAFGLERGKPYPYVRIELSNPKSASARCARDRQEIILNAENGIALVPVAPGTLPTMSALFSPLEVGNRLLGVMTIQSTNTNAYTERDASIFRTLCAYGAIALDNAAAYGAVEAARAQSARQQQELRIAAAAFESQEGMYITDANLLILRVNSAFTRITGYEAVDVVGETPAMFRSDRHPPTFYDSLYAEVAQHGTWQGELWAKRKNGDTYPVYASTTAVRSDDGVLTHYVFAIVDITERKAAEEEIRSLAFYDPLTNLPNRRLLMDRLRHALATSARNNHEGALLFVDLDNFKRLNDTRGHDIGDLLLAQVAQRLSGCLREGDTVARLGGDEFVVLLEELSTDARDAAERADWVAEKILSSLNQPYFLDNKEHHSTPSIGVCLFKGQSVSVDDLLKQADLAMYQSKAAGRNAIRFFDPAMQAAVSANAAMEADMRTALAEEQFLLYYQPQVDLYGRVVGAEALVRWRHPERGMVSPAEFIPLAEETGLILPLGQWVLETACKQLQAWADIPETAHLSIAVNISARQCHHPRFVEQVLMTVQATEANPHLLKLEITESLLLKDIDSIIAKMRALIPLGIRFSLDDFGTGYSSLSYLKRLPLEQLKIDQSFVRDIFVDANDLAIVRAIVTLGQSLGLSVIAEGVETEDQRQFLESSGCHTFQGYLFGRPGPADAIFGR